jgi:hypothetical protein
MEVIDIDHVNGRVCEEGLTMEIGEGVRGERQRKTERERGAEWRIALARWSAVELPHACTVEMHM